MRFRKKPVEVEAVQFVKPYRQTAVFCPGLVIVKGANGKVAFGLIRTLEDEMRADVGDWIIRDVQGEYYPCKPDIFEATYEPIEGET